MADPDQIKTLQKESEKWKTAITKLFQEYNKLSAKIKEANSNGIDTTNFQKSLADIEKAISSISKAKTQDTFRKAFAPVSDLMAQTKLSYTAVKSLVDENNKLERARQKATNEAKRAAKEEEDIARAIRQENKEAASSIATLQKLATLHERLSSRKASAMLLGNAESAKTFDDLANRVSRLYQEIANADSVEAIKHVETEWVIIQAEVARATSQEKAFNAELKEADRLMKQFVTNSTNQHIGIQKAKAELEKLDTIKRNAKDAGYDTQRIDELIRRVSEFKNILSSAKADNVPALMGVQWAKLKADIGAATAEYRNFADLDRRQVANANRNQSYKKMIDVEIAKLRQAHQNALNSVSGADILGLSDKGLNQKISQIEAFINRLTNKTASNKSKIDFLNTGAVKVALMEINGLIRQINGDIAKATSETNKQVSSSKVLKIAAYEIGAQIKEATRLSSKAGALGIDTNKLEQQKRALQSLLDILNSNSSNASKKGQVIDTGNSTIALKEMRRIISEIKGEISKAEREQNKANHTQQTTKELLRQSKAEASELRALLRRFLIRQNTRTGFCPSLLISSSHTSLCILCRGL